MASIDLDIKVELADTIKALNNLTKVLNSSLGGVEKETKKVGKSLTANIGGSLKKLGSQVKSGFGSITDTIFSLKGAVVGFAGVLAGRAVIGAIKDVVEAASVQEDAINQLNIALKASGQFTEAASKDFQAFASSLQETTKFGDEVILQNAALIQSLGQLDTAGLKKATAAATDLSAALGIDLTSASTLVGKAAAGNIESFSRYGLTIRKGATDAESFANTLEAINKQFGGAAAGQINTFSGATQQLSNTFGDLQETIGFAITNNPAVISGIKTLTALFQEFSKILSANAGSVDGLISGLVEGLLNSIPVILNLLADVVDAFGLVTLGLQPVVQFFDGAFQVIGNIITVFKNHFNAEFSLLKLIALEAIEPVVGVFEKLGVVGKGTLDGLKKEIETTGLAFVENTEKLGSSLLNVFDVEDRTSGFLTGVVEGSIDAGNSLRKLGTTAKDIIDKTFDKNVKIGVEVDTSSISKAGVTEDLEKTLKLKVEFDAFNQSLISAAASADDLKKIKVAEGLQKNLSEIDKFVKDKIVKSESEAAGLRATVIEQAGRELSNIVKEAEDLRTKTISDELKKQEEIQKKGADERNAKLKEAAETATAIFNGIVNAAASAFSAVSSLGQTVLSGIGAAADTSGINQKLLDDLEAVNAAVLSGQLSASEASKKRFELEVAAQDQLAAAAETNLSAVGGAVTGIIGPLLDQIVGGLGGLAGGLLNILNVPPDKLRSQIDGFIDAIPVLLQRIVENIPTLITALVDQIGPALQTLLPQLIDILADAIPKIIQVVVDLLPSLVQKLAEILPGLIITLVNILTDPKFINAITDAIGNLIIGIIDALPQIITSLVNAIPVMIRAIVRQLPGIIIAIVKAIPGIINSILLAIPEIILAIVEAIPTIIIGLIDALPELFPALINGAIEAIPKIVVAFISLIPNIIVALAKGVLGIFSSLGSSFTQIFSMGMSDGVNSFTSGITDAVNNFVQGFGTAVQDFFTQFVEVPTQFLKSLLDGLTDGIKEVFDGLTGGLSGGGGGGDALKTVATGGLNKALGFAKGIGEVPSGFPNDTLAARLSSGERVVPSDTNNQLQAFLDKDERGNRTEALLAEIATLLEQPMTVNTTAKVNGNALADIILQLSRNNARLTA